MNLRAIFGGMLPLFVMGHFSHHVLTTITVPLLPFIRNPFALDYTQSGLVVSAFTLAYGFGQLPAGWLADRLGSVRVVLAVCFSAGPAVFLLSMLPYGWALGGLLVLLGMIIFSRMSASECFIIRQTPIRSRSSILGIYYFTGMEGGGVLTPVIGYSIDRFGFTAAFAIAGGALFTITLLCSFWLWGRRY